MTIVEHANRRVGLFGGTFDPIHTGHLILAEQAREYAQLSEVWFIPAFQPPHKGDRTITPFSQRVELLQAAIADNPNFRVSLIEAERTSKSFTVDTLEELHRRHPGTLWDFIIGGDSFWDLPNWKNIRRLVQLCRFCVTTRPGSPPMNISSLATKIGIPVSDFSLLILPELQIDISSRDIRQRLHQGKSIRYLVPEKVREVLEQNRPVES